MNEYKIYKVIADFKNDIVIIQNEDSTMSDITLVNNDYNSSKFIFDVDMDYLSGKFGIKYPDGTVYIEEFTKESNTILIKTGILNQEGIYKFELALYGEDGRLTNPMIGSFNVKNELIIDTDEIIEPDDRVPILDTLINRVNNLEVTVNEHEEVRQHNEEERVAHEIERIENENTRNDQEDVREENERVRKENEAIRQDDETTRKENETNRINQYNLVNQKLENGDFTPNIKIGETETLEPNQKAYVDNIGTVKEPIFSFGIPQGIQGEKGDVGDFYFATFEIDMNTGNLIANKTQEFELLNFNIDDNGYFTVTI